ncbi:MAG TPA: GTP 3',8-cyclase MoaA [Actinomycetota bacterium]|nr:GTP 3',8-cyclase MoaA [Actinomycetota bacterium]
MNGPGQLVDGFGRVATDLRISVTDKCNFRCRYCMPAEGLQWLPRAELLSFEEIRRIAGVLVGLGIRSIKLTGGEPLVRRELPKLVSMLRAIDPALDLSLTTNGYLLADTAAELADAGLDRVTVSCDSLLKHRFAEMTLRDALDEVLDGIKTAASAGLRPVKVNAVVIRGQNDDEVVSFARLARETGYAVRFIEYMPLDAQDEWDSSTLVPGREILARISEVFPLQPKGDDSSPATTFGFADGSPGGVGIIASVTEPFCDACDRLRLTADGNLLACLFSLEETNLRDPMRAGASDEEIVELARACVAGKWAGHRIGAPDFVRPVRSMSQIGG